MEGGDPAAVCYKGIPTATCGVISSSLSCRRFRKVRLIRRFTSAWCSFCCCNRFYRRSCPQLVAPDMSGFLFHPPLHVCRRQGPRQWTAGPATACSGGLRGGGHLQIPMSCTLCPPCRHAGCGSSVGSGGTVVSQIRGSRQLLLPSNLGGARGFRLRRPAPWPAKGGDWHGGGG